MLVRACFVPVTCTTRHAKLRLYLGHTHWTCFLVEDGRVLGVCGGCMEQISQSKFITKALRVPASVFPEYKAEGCACESWQASTKDFGELGGRKSVARMAKRLRALGAASLDKPLNCTEYLAQFDRIYYISMQPSQALDGREVLLDAPEEAEDPDVEEGEEGQGVDQDEDRQDKSEEQPGHLLAGAQTYI